MLTDYDIITQKNISRVIIVTIKFGYINSRKKVKLSESYQNAKLGPRKTNHEFRKALKQLIKLSFLSILLSR